MAKNIPWTTALGSAYLNDPTDVMNAIQVMRQRAASQGTLKNTPQQRIVVAPTTRYVEQQSYRQSVVAAPGETIVIEPSQPDTVYVPHYDPWVAYGTPIPAYPSYQYQPSGYSGGDMLAAGVISFGVGIAVASLLNQHNSGWHNWDMRWDDRRQPVVYRNAPYVSHSTTVVNRVTNINQYNNVNNVNRSSTSTVNNYNTPPRRADAALQRIGAERGAATAARRACSPCADDHAELCAYPAGSGRAARATIGQRVPCAAADEHADVHAYRACGAPRAAADGRAFSAGTDASDAGRRAGASIRRAATGSGRAARRSAGGARTGRSAAPGGSAPDADAARTRHAASGPGAADPPVVRSADTASPGAGAGKTAGAPPDRRAAQGGGKAKRTPPRRNGQGARMALAADFHRGAADGHHQHAAVFTNSFIIDINADHRVGAQLFRLIFQLFERDQARLAQLFLISARAAADDIAHAGEEITKNVGAEDRFAGHNAAVFGDGEPFQGRG